MDKRPKRRKDKYNPYTLETVGNKFYVSFTDLNKIKQRVEVSQDVYDCFNEYELIDLSEMNEYDRHIEHSELLESTLENRSWKKEIPLYDVVEKKYISKKVRQAINTLPATQRQRLIKYYYQGKNYEKIAEEEGCEYQCVQRSIYRAKKKLKTLLNQFND